MSTEDIVYIETKTGTKKNDTFDITTYPVLIKNSKGSDTINFKNINNINDLTFSQEDGTKNLKICNGHDLLVTVENYFKTVGGTSTKSSIKNIMLKDGSVYSIINDGLYNYNGVFKIKKNTITGTVFNDTIDLSDPTKYNPIKGVTVKSGKGNDKIVGSIYNDKITGGAGINEYTYNAGGGFDNIYLTKNEDLTVYYDDASSEGFDPSEFRFYKSGKHWVFERTYTKDGETKTDKITFVNLAKTNSTKYIKIITRYGEDKTEEYIYDLPNGSFDGERITGTKFDETNIYRGVVTATTLGDDIDLSEYEGDWGVSIKAMTGNDRIVGTKNGDYVIAGNGDNDITAGKGDDIISLGTGSNNIRYTYSEEVKDGVDLVIGATSDDTLYLNGIEKDKFTFLKAGNNLELCFDLEDANENAVAFIGYFKSKDKFDNIIFSDSDETMSIADYLSSPYHIGDNNYLLVSGSKKITGVNEFNNGIIGSAKADTITGGNNASLTDFIVAGKGNDKITGKAGTTFLEYIQGDGSDTVYLTKDEKITLLYVNKGEDISADDFTITKSKDGKDLIVSRSYQVNGKTKTDKIVFKNAANAGVGSIELKIFKSEEYVKDKYKYDVAVADYLVATVDLLHEVFGASLSMSLNSSSQTDMDSVNYDVSSFMSSTNDGIYTDTTTVPQDYTEDILVPNMDPNQGVI